MRKQVTILCSVCLGAIVAVLLIDPVPQNLEYHAFADRRAVAMIPNGWNVISNIPLLMVGLGGLWATITKKWDGLQFSSAKAYQGFFFGIALTGLGSMFYHLAPSNDRLLWDRLPMAIAFMALFSAIIGEYVDQSAGRILLLPLTILGIGSVLYWYFTERVGAGDLRFYGLVQFLPMVLIPYIILAFKAPFTRRNDLLWVLLIYLAAKATEHFDYVLLEKLNILSGHTLKHLLSALASYWMIRMLRLRSY